MTSTVTFRLLQSLQTLIIKSKVGKHWSVVLVILLLSVSQPHNVNDSWKMIVLLWPLTRHSYFDSDQTSWKLELNLSNALLCFLVFSLFLRDYAKSCGRREGLINIEIELSKEIIQTKWLKEDKTYSHDFNCLVLCSGHSLKHRIFSLFLSLSLSLSHSDLLCLASVSMPYFIKLSSCVKYSSLSYLKYRISSFLFDFFPTFKLRIRSRYCYVSLENIIFLETCLLLFTFLQRWKDLQIQQCNICNGNELVKK